MRKFVHLVFIGIFLSSCTGDLWGSNDLYHTATPVPTNTVYKSPTPTITRAVSTSTPTSTLTITPSATALFSGSTITPGGPSTLYFSQPGDSLMVVSAHFGVLPEEISSSSLLLADGFISPDTRLMIPDRLTGLPITPSTRLLPDSEVLYSPSGVGFDVEAYLVAAGGKLATYREYLAIPGWSLGAQSVELVAVETSTSPRLILALVQYHTGWVQGGSFSGVDEEYLLGYETTAAQGLHKQMRLAVSDLATGYYGWRDGWLTELHFKDGSSLRLAPDLNAGTVALYYYFSLRYTLAEWMMIVDPQNGFMSLYTSMFGDPWERDRSVGTLFPRNFSQPEFALPFEPGVLWSLTGGPHSAWEQGSALAALDMAPATGVSGCATSTAWTVALAPGEVIRSDGGYVVIDLNGDGFEQTGWVALYLHIAAQDRVSAGTWVNAGDRIGHPSCEGGIATGTHIHIARKYNGEWISAGGPVPFVLSGWTAHNGAEPYRGTLTRDGITVTSSVNGSQESTITRQPGE